MKTKNKLILISLIILSSCSIHSVGQAQENTNDKIYEIVEKEPVYPGGLQELKLDLVRNFNYPRSAMVEKITGTEMIRFVVEVDGSITNIECTRCLGYGIDEEAISAVKKLKKFEQPAKVDGKPVRSYLNLPIKCVM